jgi:hypothetical protein
MMQANFTASNYELVLGRLDQVKELQAHVTEEEEKYTQAEKYVDSVKEEMLSSQGFLGEWQSTLLSHAYESLAQGNYSLAMEQAKNADDLPREPPHDELGPRLCSLLLRASLALLGIVFSFVLFRSLRNRSAPIAKSRECFQERGTRANVSARCSYKRSVLVPV